MVLELNRLMVEMLSLTIYAVLAIGGRWAAKIRIHCVCARSSDVTSVEVRSPMDVAEVC